jgi:hypothetical protein
MLQFGYQYDGIGNRTQSTVASHTATYSPNSRNQYDSRTVPPYLSVMGEAAADANVVVQAKPALRKSAAYWKEWSVDNTSAAVRENVRIAAAKPGAGAGGTDLALLVHDEIAKVLTAESAVAVTALPRPLKAFNGTPELNASLSRLALAFSTVVDSPRQAQILTKTLNAAITGELSAASDRLTRVLDRLMILFQGNGTTFCEDWFNARVVQHAAPTPAVTPVPTPPVK